MYLKKNKKKMLTKEKLIQEEKYELLKELQEIYDKIKADYDKL